MTHYQKRCTKCCDGDGTRPWLTKILVHNLRYHSTGTASIGDGWDETLGNLV